MSEFEWTVEGLAPKIEGFLDPLLDASGLDVGYEIVAVDRNDKEIGPEIGVALGGEDKELLLRRHAELLLALEHLTVRALRIPPQDRHRLMFDVDDYRMLRIDELCLQARAAADQVKRSGKPFKFSPMTSRERRIVHIALNDDESVTTLSEGNAPHRYTVIEPREG